MRVRVIETFLARMDDGHEEEVKPGRMIETEDERKARSWIRQGKVIEI